MYYKLVKTKKLSQQTYRMLISRLITESKTELGEAFTKIRSRPLTKQLDCPVAKLMGCLDVRFEVIINNGNSRCYYRSGSENSVWMYMCLFEVVILIDITYV